MTAIYGTFYATWVDDRNGNNQNAITTRDGCTVPGPAPSMRANWTPGFS